MTNINFRWPAIDLCTHACRLYAKFGSCQLKWPPLLAMEGEEPEEVGYMS